MSVKLDIAGNRIVASMGARLAKLSEFAHDYNGDFAAVGEIVKMPVLSCEAGVFDRETNNYAQSTGTSEASIVLSSQFVAGFNVTQKELGDGLAAFDGLFNRMGEQAGRAIAKAVETAVVGQVLSSTNTPYELSAAGDDFTGLYAACYDYDMDPENSILVVNPATYKDLISELGGKIVNLQNVIETGYVNNFLGFKRVVCSNAINENLKGFIAEYGAIGVAGRRIQPFDTYPMYNEYIDNDTGLPATLIGFQNWATGDTHITATALFGTAIVDNNHIIPLV